MENLIKQDTAIFNKAAEACTIHRMRMISSERVLVNPRYDNGTEEPTNVKQYVYTYKCFGSCGQSSQVIFKS